MKLRQLEIFDAVMRTGSVTGAAQLLSLSQPSVSTSLRHLESQLGFDLFKRVKGRLQPSPEAEVLYVYVQDVTLRLEGVGRIARDLRGGFHGSVTGAGIPGLVISILAPAATEFRREHPDAQVTFRTLSRFEVVRRVTTGEADFGLIQSMEPVPALLTEDLLQNPLMCVFREDHALAALDVVGPADLADIPTISYHSDTVIGTSVLNAFSSEGIDKRFDFQTSLPQAAFDLVSNGVGVALFDPIGLELGKHPALTYRPFEPRLVLPVKLLLAPDKPISRLGEQLIGFVKGIAASISETHGSSETRQVDAGGQQPKKPRGTKSG